MKQGLLAGSLERAECGWCGWKLELSKNLAGNGFIEKKAKGNLDLLGEMGRKASDWAARTGSFEVAMAAAFEPLLRESLSVAGEVVKQVKKRQSL